MVEHFPFIQDLCDSAEAIVHNTTPPPEPLVSALWPHKAETKKKKSYDANPENNRASW